MNEIYVSTKQPTYNGNSLPITIVGVLKDNMSKSSNPFIQCIENLLNGLGFRNNEKINEYLNSPAGQFAIEAISELNTTAWSKSETGIHVMAALVRAFYKGRIELSNKCEVGDQYGWGPCANIRINRQLAEYFMSGKNKDAVVVLAHEGSHYSYSTRYGIFSLWWKEFEYEGYRISDIVSMELRGRNWGKLKRIRSMEEVIKYVNNEKIYKWVPSIDVIDPLTFDYWNNEDIGQ